MGRHASHISGDFPAWKNALRCEHAIMPTASGRRRAPLSKSRKQRRRFAYRNPIRRCAEGMGRDRSGSWIWLVKLRDAVKRDAPMNLWANTTFLSCSNTTFLKSPDTEKVDNL